MAPMKVGDFLTYSGIKVNGEIICYAIDVNIGIYTAPGTVPGFIKVEDAIVGVPSNNPNVEVAGSRVCRNAISEVQCGSDANMQYLVCWFCYRSVDRRSNLCD